MLKLPPANAAIDAVRLACRKSRKSGNEVLARCHPRGAFVVHTCSRRSLSGYGSGRMRYASMAAKIVVFALMPRASDSVAIAKNAGRLRRDRNAKRRSLTMLSMRQPSCWAEGEYDPRSAVCTHSEGPEKLPGHGVGIRAVRSANVRGFIANVTLVILLCLFL